MSFHTKAGAKDRDDHEAWVRGLRPGDEVAIRSHAMEGGYEIRKVDRVTKVGGGRVHVGSWTFKVPSGWSTRTGYTTPFLCRVTDEVRAAIRRARREHRAWALTKDRWYANVSDETLERVIEALEAETP